MSKAVPFKLPMPMKGMYTRQTKIHNMLYAAQILNLRPLDGKLEARPGFDPYYTGFTKKKFYGFHPYNDSGNIERLVTVNNDSVVEFNENTKTARVTGLTPNMYARFVTALDACFMVNGKENKKGLDATWAELGVQGQQDAVTLTDTATGGSLVDGTYIVRVSYVVKSGDSRLLITAHDFAATTTLSGGTSTQKITVSNIRRSTNSRVTHIIVWCTGADDAVRYSTEISNPSAQTTTQDITAKPAATELAYSDYANNQGPVGAFDWIWFDGVYMWAIAGSDPTIVYRSKNGTHYDLEYYPTSYLVNMSISGFPLTHGFSLNGDVFVQTESQTYRLANSDINGGPVEVSGKIGSKYPRSWVAGKHGMLGRTNRGIEFFDGFEYHLISTAIHSLVAADTLGEAASGVLFDTPKYGQVYQLGARIPSAGPGAIEEVRGLLPGSGSMGSHLGLPSDDFDDNSKNSDRWDSTTGAGGGITEQNQRLECEMSGRVVEDMYEESKYTLEQSINVSVDLTIDTNELSSSEITNYLMLYKDADNYAEIGYHATGGSLDVEIKSKVVIAGVETTETYGTPAESFKLRIRLYHDRMETMFTDLVGAWTFLQAVTGSWADTGWKVRLGIRNEDDTSNPDYMGYFDNLRVQCQAATGLEDIAPDTVLATNEDVYQDNANVQLTCFLGTWKPGIWMPDDQAYLEPIWTIESVRAQQQIVTKAGDTLHLDNTTGKCYVHGEGIVFDDQELIPYRYESLVIDGVLSRDGKNLVHYASRNKWIWWLFLTGNWGLPFAAIVRCIPTLAYHKQTVSGYGGGTPMTSTQMQNLALANTDSVSTRVKFNKMLGTGVKVIVEKFDADQFFALEELQTELNVAEVL